MPKNRTGWAPQRHEERREEKAIVFLSALFVSLRCSLRMLQSAKQLRISPFEIVSYFGIRISFFGQKASQLSMRLIDTHCHLDDEQFDATRGDLIARAAAAGVGEMVTIAV